MKFQFKLPRPRHRDQGFALVVTLMLMILLAIIGVGLLSLSSISLRTNSRARDMAEAQANARLALMIAIGQIQMELGKDQVATAQATILAAGPTGGGNILPPNPSSPASEYSTVKNPHWLAAFPTYDPATSTPTERLFHIRRPSDTYPGGELYLYDSRYCNADMTPKNNWEWVRTGSSGNEVQWLVSNPNPTIKLQADQLTPTPLLGTSADFATTPSSGTYRGPLLYPTAGSNNAPALATIEARAPIVALKDYGGNYKGGYAYMVSDDSLKYKISLQHSVQQTSSNAPNKSDGTTYAQLLSPQNTHLEGLYLNGTADPKLQKLEYDVKTQSIKNITLSTLPMQSGDANFAKQPASSFTPFYQHSFTSNGYGLLTDPISGGLKRNLTSYLERPSGGSLKNQQITPIKPTDANELGGTANGIVQDSISDTSSLLFCLKDRDPKSNAVTPGSMTTYSDPEQRLTWFAPVFGLLRDYVQLRNPPTGSSPTIDNPVVEPRAASQAKGVFKSDYGSNNEGFDGVITSTNEPSAMTSWDSGSNVPFVPGGIDEPNLAPSKGIHPVLVKAAAYMYPSYNQDQKTTAFLIYPRIILYNPYNVKIAGRKYVVSIKRNTVTYASYCRYSYNDGTTVKNVDMYFDISNGGEIQGTLAGNQRDLVFLIDNTNEGMMPGESLLFCPDPSRGADLRGGGKYARMFKASDLGASIDKMVLTSTSKPTDGTAFYMNGPSFPEWGSGSDPQSTVNIYSGSNGSGPHGLAKRMIKLYLPAAGASLSAPLNDSLSNLSLLQAVEAVGRYEVNTWSQCPRPAPNTLSKDGVPMFSGLAATFADPRQLDLRWLHGGWLGMRLVRGNEIPGTTCIAGSDQYSLLKQYDMRTNYVGHTYDVGPLPSSPNRITWAPERNYYGGESNIWVWGCDGISATMSDPLHVLAGDPPLNMNLRPGLNVMSAFLRTGNISANAANSFLFEVPRRNVPVISLGEFQNAHLNSFIGAPTYMIGNSYGTRLAPRSGSAASWDHLQNSYKFTAWYYAGKDTLLTWLNYCVPYAAQLKPLATPFHYQIYDHSFEMNHSLWDRFFLTGVEGDPAAGASSPAAISLPSDPSDPTRLDASKKLPNPRLIASPYVPKLPLKKDVVSYFKASENLVVDGAFNVNCTDPLAWQALLASFRKINPPASSGGTVSIGNDSSFSRLLTPPLNRNGDPTGLSGNGSIWQQFRCLSDAQIETLSNLIVEQVKRRAPFISVSDFVNRRLLGGDPSSSILGPSAETVITKWGLKGLLQTVIDDSGINSFLPPPTTSDPWYAPPAIPATIDAYSPTHAKGNTSSSKYADALGYLTQGDILAKIGSVLTVRGDTFTIRAYGDSRDASGNILASARCEATIQRIPEYVDTILVNNNPVPPPQTSFAKLTSDINRNFGRKFKIIAFRWLSSTE